MKVKDIHNPIYLIPSTLRHNVNHLTSRIRLLSSPRRKRHRVTEVTFVQRLLQGQKVMADFLSCGHLRSLISASTPVLYIGTIFILTIDRRL
ncbi:hypothetical protein PoB_002627800 [Plakobranchus ocellatus]|uniref:Uncharacterized protein n=1 Tax=Plakobranchus ocellatus TaxID=259542 RepID=A0AAV3ZZF9_9GAST|nr:hypothetical protein PoB_002627800 [Plakobranchus ocellatus]